MRSPRPPLSSGRCHRFRGPAAPSLRRPHRRASLLSDTGPDFRRRTGRPLPPGRPPCGNAAPRSPVSLSDTVFCRLRRRPSVANDSAGVRLYRAPLCGGPEAMRHRVAVPDVLATPAPKGVRGGVRGKGGPVRRRPTCAEFGTARDGSVSARMGAYAGRKRSGASAGGITEKSSVQPGGRGGGVSPDARDERSPPDSSPAGFVLSSLSVGRGFDCRQVEKNGHRPRPSRRTDRRARANRPPRSRGRPGTPWPRRTPVRRRCAVPGRTHQLRLAAARPVPGGPPARRSPANFLFGWCLKTMWAVKSAEDQSPTLYSPVPHGPCSISVYVMSCSPRGCRCRWLHACVCRRLHPVAGAGRVLSTSFLGPCSRASARGAAPPPPRGGRSRTRRGTGQGRWCVRERTVRHTCVLVRTAAPS